MRIEGQSVSFTVNIDSELPNELIGDEIRLRQILINLLSNAAKFTHEGNIHFTVRGQRKGDTILLVFSIKDTGIGIRQEDIGKLFDTFSQMDTRKNRSIQGTGLGLAISKNLCELMHGTIVTKSEYGKGSEFTATIPQAIVDYKPLAQVDHPGTNGALCLNSAMCTAKALWIPCTICTLKPRCAAAVKK